ncbi:hypothetical protein FQN53_001200 [Emmonsiellopsis sp. PD_33]|nr:hypothetical protein FQN53_001200 [Emmonsiellopsis sp. PD_33]
MPLVLSEAIESDAGYTADIHLAAFASNPMFRAQFPTPAVRAGLRSSLVEKTLADLSDPKCVILVVRDGDEIISFAKWTRPIPESETYLESPWRWPEGTMLSVLNEWNARTEYAVQQALMRIPCYRLSFIATSPQHEHRGAATMLIRWALERSRSEVVPIALEGTSNAVPLYEKLGFEPVGKISMVLEVTDDGDSEIYEETCFVFQPEDAFSTILSRSLGPRTST